MIEPLILVLSVTILCIALYIFNLRKKELSSLKNDLEKLRNEQKTLQASLHDLQYTLDNTKNKQHEDNIKDNEKGKFITQERIKNKIIEKAKEDAFDDKDEKAAPAIQATKKTSPGKDLKDLKNLMERASELRLTALRENMKKLIGEIETELSKANVEQDFKIVGADFIAILSQRFPELSVNEVRICTYIRLGYATKEIAGFLNVEPESVSKARNRLRKKLGIDSKTHIEDFLDEIMNFPKE